MSFMHDSRGIKEDSFPKLPEKKWFEFKIVEAEEMKSKNGLNMIKMVVKLINDPEWDGTKLTHYLTFILKGDPGEGMSVHFRKSIGVPYGGNDLVNAEEWIGKRFKATTVLEEYKGISSSKLKLIAPCDIKAEKDEESPF